MSSVNPDNTEKDANIVIVGSGIAGISAAVKLINSGFQKVRILEASGRSGGRIKTGKLGNNIVEIGANWIHGPCEENPVFCLARQYGLLEPEALTPENQAMDVREYPPWVPNFFTSSGRKLNTEVALSLQTTCLDIFDETFDYQGDQVPFPSVGEFVRSKFTERWKDADEATKSLAFSVASNSLKVECCYSGAHSMDAVGLGGFNIYKDLPGLDCTFPKLWLAKIPPLCTHAHVMHRFCIGAGQHLFCRRHIQRFSNWLIPSVNHAHREIAEIMHPLRLDIFEKSLKNHVVWLARQLQGYEGLIKNLLLEVPPDTVTYNCPVRCIEWNSTEAQSPVKVECEVGTGMTADHVIVTVSLGYLKKHHSSMFSPPLPLHKLQSIQRQGFGTNNKIYVEFDSPWWDADCEVIYFLWEDEDAMVDQMPDVQSSWIKKLYGFNVLKPTERYGHVLCGWIAGHESEYMETLSEQEVEQNVTHLTRRFTGNPILTPKRVLRSQWFHDPWTCGSYSFPGIGCSSQDLSNLEEPLPNTGSQPLQVLFAGEATHPCFYSTVHGALLSGWREADRLISHYATAPSNRQNFNK